LKSFTWVLRDDDAGCGFIQSKTENRKSKMLQAFINMWRIPELRNKLLFTLGMLLIFRLGHYIPLPAVDQAGLQESAQQHQGTAMGALVNYVSIFTGGALGHSTIFGLGVMPYISASIIFQLLATVLPSLKALQNEGPAGRQKIQEYTRYTTVLLSFVQGAFWLSYIRSMNLVYPEYQVGGGAVVFWLCGVVGLTAGAVFLMWIGEQIDKYGIGNGVSLIITGGIVSQMPVAIGQIASDFSVRGGDAGKYGVDTVIFLAAAFVVVIAGSIVITQGQRRIPIQQAKHTRGRRVYGGQKSYLPLRVNHGGVMPIIFASSLMIFPVMILGYLTSTLSPDGTGVNLSGFALWLFRALDWLNRNLSSHGYLYILMYVGLIYFFAYFWTTVQFQPSEMATQLRDHGSFIPGLRPGPRTADYLETVMERITYVGAGFLAVIAVVPTIVGNLFKIDFMITQFLGGTGLLIVVSVMLDFVQRIEASLMMRNYQGFLGEGGGGKGKRIRGARAS
jgi:preprotein translocase subunit SecY